jgi:hypothetical protein
MMLSLHKCSEDGCVRFLQEGFDKCFAHGGWSPCLEYGCNKRSSNNNLCVYHNKKRCVEVGCNNIPRQGISKCIVHGGCKVCMEPGCSKVANLKTRKCKVHGRIICINPGCDKTVKKGGYDKCVTHANERLCKQDGCDKLAYGKYNKCINHFGVKCVIPGCERRIRYIQTHCSTHKKTCIVPGCTNIKQLVDYKCIEHGGGRRCDVMGCNKLAINIYDKCIDHRLGKKCIEPGCNNNSIGKTHCCKRHGGGRRCEQPNCNKSAVGTSYKCISHGGGKRCPNCINWIDSRSGSTEYDNYCVTCFKHLFPDDPRSRKKNNHMTKEIMVRNFINDHFDGFIHNVPMYTGNCNCTHRRRIDHRKLIGNTILAIETDEFGHRGYDRANEEIRYDDVYMIHSGKWIFIRFNPDNNVSKVDIEDKLTKLKETMDECIDRIEYEENTELVEIIKLFC